MTVSLHILEIVKYYIFYNQREKYGISLFIDSFVIMSETLLYIYSDKNSFILSCVHFLPLGCLFLLNDYSALYFIDSIPFGSK